MVGTGTAHDSWGRNMNAAQSAAPLVAALLDDLKAHAKTHPMPSLLPAPQVADAAKPVPAKTAADWRRQVFSQP